MLESDQSGDAEIICLNSEEAQFLSTIATEREGAGCTEINEHVKVENAFCARETVTVGEERQEKTFTGLKNPEENSKASQTEHVVRTLQSTIAVMSSKVEQLEQQVLQVTRIRSTLKRTKPQASVCVNYTKGEKGSGNKKQRLLDAARNEAARRRRMTEHVRLFANILRQLMQHKWAWPFMKPVDVEGLRLHDYYRVIRKPMDLGTVRNRLEAKDGSGYRHVREMCEDVRLVFRNAMMYNESWTDVHKMAKTLSHKFEDKWKTVIEPRLLEDEENSFEDQQEGIASEIAELRAGEEQAAKQLGDDVLLQLTNIENQLEGFITKVLSKCRPMNLQEKQELGRRFHELPPPWLDRIIEIMSPSTGACDAAMENVHVNLEALDVATLWRLHFFVKMVTAARDKKAAGDMNEAEGKTTTLSQTV